MPMTSDAGNSRPAAARPEPTCSPVSRAAELLLGRDTVASPRRAVTSPRPAAGGTAGEPAGSAKLRLVLLSFLMLFVELALIRWLGANIVYLSYYSNFVLLGSFLGIGIGFLRARSRINLFPWTPVALALLVLFVLRFPVQISHTSGRQLIFFGALKTTGLPTWLMLPVIFLAVAVVMAMLVAYGSRIGLIQFAALGALAGILTAQSMASRDLWSPYYRITVGATTAAQTIPVMVNGIPHQAITAAARRPRIFYTPYLQAPGNSLNNVLVVGAGTGNDVAGALRMGARHVDAVEIDPMIYKIGTRLNTDRPYQSPRVSVHINDGRAFLSQTKKKYDLILFALPDSLTLVAGQSSLRLESYLFTLQAIQSARAHLVPGTGVFAMYNYYRTAWLKDRLANTLDVAYGHAPCATSVGLHEQQLSVLTIGASPAAVQCIKTWHRPASVLAPATDDHPFIYLAANTIPSFYLVTLALILLASVLLVRTVSGPYRRVGRFADLFFMGAAFMLLETKSVVQLALLFGTTWFVNALVFAGVLLAVLAAVQTSRRVVVRRPQLLYAGLLATLAVAWIVPQESLLALTPVPRFALAVLIAFAPIFLANLVFTQRFRDVGDSTVAFAANLLGAMVGGVIEYLSLITGYRALLIVVAGLYGLAFLTGRRHVKAVRETALGPSPVPSTTASPART